MVRSDGGDFTIFRPRGFGGRKITRLKGKAEIIREAVPTPITASLGMDLELHDRIETAVDSRLRIELIDGSILSLGEEADLDLSEFEFDPREKKRSALFGMDIGKVRVFANDLEGFRKRDFKIQTPTAICGVRGTLFLVWVKSKGSHRWLPSINLYRLQTD